MAGANTLTITDDNFDAEVLNATVPVLVDFWAEWCMPCRSLAPIIDEVADEYVGKVKVGKLDIDANQQISSKLGIQIIPTILLFKGGQQVKKFVGTTSKKVFKEALDEFAK